MGKNFIAAIAPSNKTFDSDYCHFQVQAMEHVANPELLVPLPLSNVTHSDLAGQYPSSALVLTDATQSDQLATPPPVNFASQKNEKIQPKEHQQASCTEEIPQGEKRENTDDSSTASKAKKVALQSSYFLRRIIRMLVRKKTST